MFFGLEESWNVLQERDDLILGLYALEGQPRSIGSVPPGFGADLMPSDLDRVKHIILAAMNRAPSFANSGVKSFINTPISFTSDANPLTGEMVYIMHGCSPDRRYG